MNKAEKIETALRLVWDSLESHLSYTYKKEKGEDMKFHKKCVQDYATLLKIISELYD